MQAVADVISRVVFFFWHDMWGGVHPAIVRFVSVGLLGNLVLVPLCVVIARVLFGALRGRR